MNNYIDSQRGIVGLAGIALLWIHLQQESCRMQDIFYSLQNRTAL